MAIGNIGPRKTPMKETAMALPIREGVNHIVISKLLDLNKSSVHIGKIERETYPIARSA
jgi:hypothetical protein